MTRYALRSLVALQAAAVVHLLYALSWPLVRPFTEEVILLVP